MDQNEQKIREIAQGVYAENQTKGQFSPLKIPAHSHNGLDNLRVSEVNLINRPSFAVFFTSYTSEIFQIINVPNPVGFTFYGFAANNAGGGSASQRAVVSGYASFGNGTRFSSTDGNSFSTLTANTGIAQNILQGSSSMFLNGAVSRVGASSLNFAYVTDGGDIVRATVIRYDSGSITIETVLAPGWQITGDLIIT